MLDTTGVQARATADHSKTLYSERYGQTMHSLAGAVTESRHVFVAGSSVALRLREGLATRVLEVGFGSGLNFFLTADLALETGTALDYVGLEHDLLPSHTIRQLGFEAHLKHSEFVEAFLEARANLPIRPERGSYHFKLTETNLELRLGEATEQTLGENFDAIYQDAFSPDANPELWSEAFLQKLYTALKSGGTLSSYCVKGEVRRRLTTIGFDVKKRPGPAGGKREVLLAVKPS